MPAVCDCGYSATPESVGCPFSDPDLTSRMAPGLTTQAQASALKLPNLRAVRRLIRGTTRGTTTS